MLRYYSLKTLLHKKQIHLPKEWNNCHQTLQICFRHFYAYIVYIYSVHCISAVGARVTQLVRSFDLTTHTSLSPYSFFIKCLVDSFLMSLVLQKWFDFDFWCFNATFKNISAISWRPVLVANSKIDIPVHAYYIELAHPWITVVHS
jgi:hypothetical protein